jgi:hypothetical protein
MQLELIAGTVALSGNATIILAVLRKKAVMNIATWGLLTFLNSAVFMAALQAGERFPWLPLGYATGAAITTFLTLFHGTWNWGKVETVCCIATVLSLFGWLASPAIALVGAIGAMCIALVPQAVAFWKDASGQPALPWVLFSIASVVSLTDVSTPEEAYFPAVGLMANVLMLGLILRHRRT